MSDAADRLRKFALQRQLFPPIDPESLIECMAAALREGAKLICPHKQPPERAPNWDHAQWAAAALLRELADELEGK